MSRALVPTLTVAEHVYGGEVPLDDAAETYHEASRLSPHAVSSSAPGLRLLLDGDPVLHASVARASRRRPHRPSIELEPTPLPAMPLETALAERRSQLASDRRPLPLHELATILLCGYGSVPRDDGDRRRVPSGGALYPLELYVLPLSVARLPPRVCHFDPYAHRLELLRDLPAPEAELAQALVDPSLVGATSAAVVVTAVFWRSRFKYGQRGYRFALLEAGHVVQNVLLAAAALGLPALPVGGFYDRTLDELLGIDGIDESSLYVVLLGGGSP